MTEPPKDAFFAVNGHVGELVLNRPGALNALNLPMIRTLRQGLDAFATDDDVRAIVIRSAAEAAFCAGGDVRHIRDLVLRGAYDCVEAFFTEEYALNAAIAACRKPYIALIDGVCFGGGLGLSVHGRFRVVTQRARLAMPETAIGFFPDVGASFFLPRLPGAAGLWLGLTGARIDGADAVALGLATHHVTAEGLAELRTALSRGVADVDTLLGAFATEVPAGRYAADRAEIDALFAAGTLSDVFAALRAAMSPFARDALETLARMSPNGLRLTADLIAAGRDTALDACLAAERAAALEATRHPDFTEGIRAMLVDKDRNPRWRDPSA